MDEIPRIIGAIDGLQGGVNESRNASVKTSESVNNIENMGHVTIKINLPNGNRLCFFSDLDGHVIEIMEKGF